MAKYLIHSCKDRYWYVRYYLIPSLKKQGIPKEDIIVYNDDNKEGLLTSFIKSYDYIGDEDAWHLQDDIVLSKDFKKVADAHDTGIVCGFCNSFSRGNPGYVCLWNMWYSMPCIRIPGDILRNFIVWLKEPATQRRLKVYFEDNKHDDVLFEIFLREQYPHIRVGNVSPNMVNHIDHLIGGSLVNKDRNKKLSEVMSTYWGEPEVLIDVEQRLKKRRDK